MDQIGKVFLLGLVVLLLSVVIDGNATPTHRVCANESRVELSILNGLRHQHVMKENRMHEFEKEVDEVKLNMAKVEQKLAAMQAHVNITRDEADEIASKMENMTTPNLAELEEHQICTEDGYPTDCCQIKKLYPSAPSGIYSVKDPCSGDKPLSYAKLAVYCDMETDGGGWIVIQRRNASMGWVNFTRNFNDYEIGFGDIDGEFWMGLKNMHELTFGTFTTMRIKLWNDDGTSMSWKYTQFQVNPKNRHYYVYVSGGTGDGNYDAFGQTINSNTRFETYDRGFYSAKCGYTRQSGWWYYHGVCNSHSNPNGRHKPSGICGTDWTGERLVWRTPSGYRVFTHSEMKIRPRSCTFDS